MLMNEFTTDPLTPNANCKIFFIADTENYLYYLQFKIPSRTFRQLLPEQIHRRTEMIMATSELLLWLTIIANALLP